MAAPRSDAEDLSLVCTVVMCVSHCLHCVIACAIYKDEYFHRLLADTSQEVNKIFSHFCQL